MSMNRRGLVWTFALLAIAWAAAVYVSAAGQRQGGTGLRPGGGERVARPATGGARTATSPHAVIDRYCLNCHNDIDFAGDLSFEAISLDDVAGHAEAWEKVVRKLRVRAMPPRTDDTPRPAEPDYDAVVAYLETALDRAAAANPNPGRTATIRRLTRTEYQNAIRDLLALDIDAAALLPADEPSYGFDNVMVGTLSPTLLDRYVSAAEKISRIAVGRPTRSPGGETIRVPADLTQEDHLEGLPVGTRGGAVVRYTFPLDGEYEFQIRLTRDRDEFVEGLSEPHDLELLIDKERVQLFTVRPPQREPAAGADEPPSHDLVDRHLTVRVPVRAGPRTVGVAFPKMPTALLESARQPYRARFNSYRHPRVQPAIYSVSIIGPYAATGAGETPSRRRIFVSRPSHAGQEEGAAREILRALMRKAYRRPITDEDLQGPLQLFRQARADGDFDAGIELALAAVLVSPQFLFRVEADPEGLVPGAIYGISDLDLASRLSFFLWSSIPDDELLDVAIAGQLHEPAVLERQVRRMLADPRSRALVTNFAAQWLHLRSLEASAPDMRLFPEFDHNLRDAFRQETELFFESILREDRSALDLLSADYTFVNERLARHYGIPHVYGSRFRRITREDDSGRGGLLRHASILTVTSYATRTSPVIRGKWILDNVLGIPPPPPLPDVPDLEDATVDGSLSVRQRLAEHRENPVCAGCHNLMDPIGLSLERFDAIGRVRTVENGIPVDASGGLPDGTEFTDVAGLEEALLKRPEVFIGTLTEKLLIYALGRGVEAYDAPEVRRIVREARAENFRLSSIILGVVKSKPFLMRMSP
jgi:mono/diheme cytochrome c family protein